MCESERERTRHCEQQRLAALVLSSLSLSLSLLLPWAFQMPPLESVQRLRWRSICFMLRMMKSHIIFYPYSGKWGPENGSKRSSRRGLRNRMPSADGGQNRGSRRSSTLCPLALVLSLLLKLHQTRRTRRQSHAPSGHSCCFYWERKWLGGGAPRDARERERWKKSMVL